METDWRGGVSGWMCTGSSRRSRSGGWSGDPGGLVRYHPEGVRAFADGLGPADEVALEATGNTWAIATLLASRAGRVVVPTR